MVTMAAPLYGDICEPLRQDDRKCVLFEVVVYKGKSRARVYFSDPGLARARQLTVFSNPGPAGREALAQRSS